MTTVISVENLSKSYRLGQIGTGTFAHDLSVWWAKVRGKPNPLLRIGETERLPSPARRGGPEGSGEAEEIWALRDVSFTVEQGEVLGIIGRNGAGKSTLLKILSRVTAPTSGRIRVKGRVASLLEVGTGFHPELTGRENVYLNGAIMGMDRQEVARKFDEIVDFAGVEKFIETPVKRYSSGMYVRLAFAVAAHLEPEILVVDEVLAVGDAEFQKKCLGKMGEVAHEGRTVLFVSHNMAAVQSLCHRGLWIEAGQVAQDGPVNDVVLDYIDKLASKPVEDISEIMDRKGLGKIRFRSIEFLNASRKKINVINAGAQLIIRLYYDAPFGHTFRGAKFSIAVEKNDDVCFVASTEMVRTDEIKISGSGWIDCVFERWPLAPGHYQLTLYCKADGGVQDWIKGAVEFTVDGGDFFGSGRLSPDGYQGKNVLIAHEWKCE